MKNRTKTPGGLFLLGAVILLAWSVPQAYSSTLVYPGNGIPVLSKNKEIRELSEELEDFSKKNPYLTFKSGTLSFDAKNDILFTSRHSITGRTFCLQTNVTMEHGLLKVRIGNLLYKISENSMTVSEKGKAICGSHDNPIRDIIIESFDEESVSTRFHSHERLLDIVPIDIQVPAKITIKIKSGSSGKIGSWVWLRGYE